MELTQEEIKEMQRIVSSELGKRSWESRIKGKTKKQIKEMMAKVSKSSKKRT